MQEKEKETHTITLTQDTYEKVKRQLDLTHPPFLVYSELYFKDRIKNAPPRLRIRSWWHQYRQLRGMLDYTDDLNKQIQGTFTSLYWYLVVVRHSIEEGVENRYSPASPLEALDYGEQILKKVFLDICNQMWRCLRRDHIVRVLEATKIGKPLGEEMEINIDKLEFTEEGK
jgi:hypothetical protein